MHSHTDYWESRTPRLAPYTLSPVYRACVTPISMLYCTYTASRDSGECGLDWLGKFVSCPLEGQGHAEVKRGVIVSTIQAPDTTEPNAPTNRRYRYAQSYIDACHRPVRRALLLLLAVLPACPVLLCWFVARQMPADSLAVRMLVLSGALTYIGVAIGVLLAQRTTIERTKRMLDSATLYFESDVPAFTTLLILDFGPATRMRTRRIDLHKVTHAIVSESRHPGDLMLCLRIARTKLVPFPRRMYTPPVEDMEDFLGELEQRLPCEVTYTKKPLSILTPGIIAAFFVLLALMLVATSHVLATLLARG